MLSIARILNKGDINRRFQRIAVVGVPTLLLVLSQGVVSAEVFKAMVTVAAIIAAFTPLARGGFFHNFKFAVINDEKIAVSKAVFMLVTILVASQCFSAMLYSDDSLKSQGLAIWLLYSAFSFMAFLSVVMVEMYFYDYRQRKVAWPVILLMIGVICAAFFYMVIQPIFWGQFSRLVSQFAGISVLSLMMFYTFRDRFFFGGGWDVVKEKSFWIGINVAIVISLLAYIARSEVIAGGSEEQDILLANCLLVFGILRLFLYREIRSLERFYLKSSLAIVTEWLFVVLLSLLVLAVSEAVTFFFMAGFDLKEVSLEWHLRAFSSVVSLFLTMLVGGKVLRLFERGAVAAILLTIVVSIGFGLSYFFPAWSLAFIFAAYVFSHFFLSDTKTC